MLDHKPGQGGSPSQHDIIAALESLLVLARENRFQYLVAVTCESPMQNKSILVGQSGMEFSAAWGLRMAEMKLINKVYGGANNIALSEGKPPAETPDRVQWDMSEDPSCYDFICWLVNAEMRRRRSGLPGPLKIGFSIREGDLEWAYHNQLRKQVYEGIIFPSLEFLGAVKDDSAVTAPTLKKFTCRPIVEASRAGEFVPYLTPPPDAVKLIEDNVGKQSPVTITLRESKLWEYRNSNMPEWLKVAEHLRAQGERVIFVRDTSRADDPIPGWETCPLASKDILVRQALYECARCNFFVSNGPWHLALFGTRPWLMFVELDPSSTYFPETPEFWWRLHGIRPNDGEQFPWSTRKQRIIPKRDNADTIIEAWEKLEL